MKFKSMKKVSEDSNIYEMVFEKEVHGKTNIIKVHEVNFDDMSMTTNHNGYDDRFYYPMRSTIEFEMLLNPDLSYCTIETIEPLDTTTAVNGMKEGKLYKSEASGRFIGYGKCITVASNEGSVTSGFYNPLATHWYLRNMCLAVVTFLTSEEILGEWTLYEED